ncbi:hypothetical protein [Micromonospora aurantiaca]|uniref:hypothetical protein n=1 Tax=Micromonospora aurantiaca (nom. illeg.) TaxID=47850 RepID=UPI0011ABF4BA|nr:hypothetical protein [Micromonospora aurantiaca]UFN92644.1 hypothetical protein LF814_21925 [Micromonospora aurantiaca]
MRTVTWPNRSTLGVGDKAVSERCLFRLDSLAELPEMVRHNESAASCPVGRLG